MSLEDEIFAEYLKRRAWWLRRLFRRSGGPLPNWLGGRLASLAQRAAERHHAGVRRDLLRVDDQLSDLLAFTGRGE